MTVQLGLDTFGDITQRPDGTLKRADEVLRDVVEEAVVADQAGVDFIGLGEHHRPDYMASSPATILAAAAVQTKTIRLTSAVSVLSSDDPVRVFQQFATVDLLSNGRVEMMAGRGSFIESFPLFGYDLEDYDLLFAEKLQLLMEIRENEVVTWEGQTRKPIQGRGVYPRPLQDPLPLWIAIGGTLVIILVLATLALVPRPPAWVVKRFCSATTSRRWGR